MSALDQEQRARKKQRSGSKDKSAEEVTEGPHQEKTRGTPMQKMQGERGGGGGEEKSLKGPESEDPQKRCRGE